VTLRFFSNPSRRERAFIAFSRSTCGSMGQWFLSWLSRTEWGGGWPDGLQDAAWGLPELALWLVCLSREIDVDQEWTEQRPADRELLIDTSAGIFTLLHAMGVEIARSIHGWELFPFWQRLHLWSTTAILCSEVCQSQES